jgi:hypothetical protein
MAAEPRIREAVQAAGLPAPAFEGHEVIDMTILAAAVRG